MAKKKKVKFSRDLTPTQVQKYKEFGTPDMSQNWLELFTDDLVSDLFTIMRSCSDNQQKAEYVERELKHLGFSAVAEGTNILVMANSVYPGVVFKIALDDNGVADNFNDCILQDCVPRYVPVYARHPSSIVSVQPRGVLPTPDQMVRFRPDIIRLLKEMSKYFLIADLSPDMFLNYIVDRDGKFLICDGSDLYPLHQFKDKKLPRCKRITGSHRKTGEYKHCEGKLHYSEDFKWLICEKCGREYNPLEFRPKKEVQSVYQMLTDGFSTEECERLEEAALAVISRKHGIEMETSDDDDEVLERGPDADGDYEEDEDLPDVNLGDEDEDNDEQEDDYDDAVEDELLDHTFVVDTSLVDASDDEYDDEADPEDEDGDVAYVKPHEVSFAEMQALMNGDDPDIVLGGNGEDEEDDNKGYMILNQSNDDQVSETDAIDPYDHEVEWITQVILSSKTGGVDYHQAILDYLVNMGYQPTSAEQTVPAQGDNAEDIQGIIDDGVVPEKAASVQMGTEPTLIDRTDEPMSEFELAVNDGQSDSTPKVFTDVVEYILYLKRRNIFAYSDLLKRVSEATDVAMVTAEQAAPIAGPHIKYKVIPAPNNEVYPAVYIDINTKPSVDEIDEAFKDYGLPVFVSMEGCSEYYLGIEAQRMKTLLKPAIDTILKAKASEEDPGDSTDESVENDSDNN